MLSVGGFIAWSEGAVREAGAFLDLLREGKVEEAYQSAAPAFRAVTPEKAFIQFSRDFPFSSLEKVQWKERSMSLAPLGMTLAGSLTFAGSPLPSSLTLVSHSGAWKVANVRVNVQEEGEKTEERPALPDDAPVLELVRGTMGTFARAMGEEDFSKLHASFAVSWKEQMTSEDLSNAFVSLLQEEGLDLSTLGTATPSLSVKPRFNEEDLLVVQGSYKGAPPLRFDIRYAWEKKAWKLAGLFVRLDDKKR